MAGMLFSDRYLADRLLGEGGMGKVYLGRQLDNGRKVVIKVMHDHVADDPRFRQAFEREMALMMRFRHPYAVALYDASMADPHRPFIVMEYVAGITLEELVAKHGRLPALRVGGILAQLGQVLQSAHENDIVHRDLTLVNIMVANPDRPEETIKVMDFGLARLTAQPYIPLEKLTGQPPSIGGGTPDYVAPEQVRGEEVDHRADLYSVGVLLFKMLTGFLPFEKATTTEQILRAHVETTPPRFAELGLATAIPPGVEAVVRACLAKYPRERPQSALELVRRFEKALVRTLLPAEIVRGEMAPPTSANPHLDPRSVMDQLEAWMPEPIAVVKLRGFAHDMGGEFVNSEPGLIRVRIPDPTCPPPPQARSGLISLLKGPKKVAPPVEHILVELLLEKCHTPGRNLLQMSITMKPERHFQKINDPQWRQGCERICRDLRAYLIGR